MQNRIWLLGIVLLFNTLTLAHSAPIDPLQTIAWLDGVWISEQADEVMEEHWSFSKNGLLGMFREIKNGRSTFFEIMCIEQEEHEVLLRIRHFGPALKTAWEERDNPMTFILTQFSDSLAIFAGANSQQGERLIYRLNNRNSLTITGEFLHSGKKVVEIFSFIRKNSLSN